MKLYILRVDYTDIDPEGMFDEEQGGYVSTSYRVSSLVGVYANLEDAIRQIVQNKHLSPRDFIVTEVDTECVGEDGGMQCRHVDYEEYKGIHIKVSADLHGWRVEDFDKADKQFADKDWFVACCKDCPHKKVRLGSDVGFGRCMVLYDIQKAETNCGKVKGWIEKNNL